MNFKHYNLGYQNLGKIVEINLSGSECNVKLMDTTNFNKYKNRRKHQYYGGHVTQSSVRLQIPHSGNWHLAIDLGGYRGQVKSAVSVL